MTTGECQRQRHSSYMLLLSLILKVILLRIRPVLSPDAVCGACSGKGYSQTVMCMGAQQRFCTGCNASGKRYGVTHWEIPDEVPSTQ